MGEPGCPELAACTASMHKVRIVLIASFSIGARSLATVRPVFTGNPSAGGYLKGFHSKVEGFRAGKAQCQTGLKTQDFGPCSIANVLGVIPKVKRRFRPSMFVS